MNAEIKKKAGRSAGRHVYEVKFTLDTPGQVIALRHALEQYGKVSPVCADILAFFQQAHVSIAAVDLALNDSFVSQ